MANLVNLEQLAKVLPIQMYITKLQVNRSMTNEYRADIAKMEISTISLLGLRSITATAKGYKGRKAPSIRRSPDHPCCQYSLDYLVLVHKEVMLCHWEN